MLRLIRKPKRPCRDTCYCIRDSEWLRADLMLESLDQAQRAVVCTAACPLFQLRMLRCTATAAGAQRAQASVGRPRRLEGAQQRAEGGRGESRRREQGPEWAAQPPTGAHRTSEANREYQLGRTAFEAGDFAAAFSLCSPKNRERLASPEKFGAICRGASFAVLARACAAEIWAGVGESNAPCSSRCSASARSKSSPPSAESPPVAST